MLNEQKIIDSLKHSFPLAGGIGDDAAVFGNYVITKDLLVEDVHFRRKYVDPISLGYKALQVNLSDIAAMGAKATYVLLGIAIPKNCKQYIESFLKSFSEACHTNNIQLIGGDTTASQDKLYISVTAIGITENPKLRSGAKIGDIICVIGNLGDSHIGLQSFERDLAEFAEFKKAFLQPEAKIKEGIWLGSQAAVTAMMDISDGLLVDLKKLCAASEVAGKIALDQLANTTAFYAACSSLNLDPIAVMLTGGEDYGLLITVAPDKYKKLITDANFPIKAIGTITEGNKGEVVFDGNTNLTLKEFSHFGEL